MKIIFAFLVLLCLIATVFGTFAKDLEAHRQFAAFMKKYNKTYATIEEFNLRLQNFKRTLERIQKRSQDKRYTATYGINKFSDLSPEEFKAKYLIPPSSIKRRNNVSVVTPRLTALPSTFDWRTKGAVTPVKDQEQCGSCWAFSVTENVESVWILSGHGTNSSVNLSPQQIVDCDRSDLGCNGGDPPTAYEYIIRAGGLESENAYPYKGVDQTCHFNSSAVVAKISNWKYATNSYDETTLQQNLVSWSPLSICVDAANWQDYTGGVMTAWECAWIVSLDHCVQLIGYDTTASTPFYIVRNSWNTDWGDKGYIYLEMNANTCGLTEEATTAVA